jgi:hypothetical protein
MVRRANAIRTTTTTAAATMTMARVVDDIASSIPWQQALSGKCTVGLTFTAYPEQAIETDAPANCSSCSPAPAN